VVKKDKTVVFKEEEKVEQSMERSESDFWTAA
jgi:hypothetical protein